MTETAGSKYTLRGLRINNAALAADELPGRIKLLHWGRNESTRGQVIVDAQTVKLLPSHQREQGFETVAIDFDHNSLPGSDTYEKGKAIEIAGYGTPRVVAGDGLWLEQIQWTPAGEKFARNYKDLSPAPGLTPEGVVVFLHSAALTPNGSVYDLEFFSASPTKSTTQPMPEPKPLTIVALASLLGLPETATEADLQSKIKTFTAPDLKPTLDQVTALKARLDALPTNAAQPNPELVTRLEALTARIDRVEQAAAASGAAREQIERDQLVAEASREGKVIPLSADTIKALPLAALRELVGKLAKNVVPLHARAGAGGDTTTGNLCAFSAAVSAKVKAGKSKAAAIIESVREHPEAYHEYRELGAPAL